MRRASRPVSPTAARRLAVRAQLLDAERPGGVLEAVSRLGCLQLDPTSAVARSPLLVLHSRIGPAFDAAELDRELWDTRTLFEYWAHAASIVLSEDYGVHHLLMRRWRTGAPRTSYQRRERAWVEENRRLRGHILRRLRRDGPLRSRDFADRSTSDWHSGGWSNGRNVQRMLDWLWMEGRVLVAGRLAGDRVWDLAERVLPDHVGGPALSERQVVLRATERALRALGVATTRDIEQHFTRRRYPRLDARLAELRRAGRVVPVDVEGQPAWVHAEALGDLEAVEAGDWEGRAVALSPFDNLVCDRDRTERLFGFRYRIEIYVPRARRRYGYFVMPVLSGDRLVARVDPAYDRATGTLAVRAVHVEPGAGPDAARAVRSSMAELAGWLGARDVSYTRGGTAG